MSGPIERVKRGLRDFADLEKSFLDQAMRDAAPLASGALLDVGCGDKPYEPLFAPHVTKYVGVEYDDTYSDSANARKGRADHVYSGDRLPFDDGSFDTVLCNQVLEHVPDPAALFVELGRVLKKGGRLIVTVPFSYRVHSSPHDFHRFTRFALTRYAESNGLAVDRIDTRGGFWIVVGQKLTSHVALRYARLGSEVQALGGFGYERAIAEPPRYWTLPLVAPAILGLSAAARVLDRIDRDDSDTTGYILVATKR